MRDLSDVTTVELWEALANRFPAVCLVVSIPQKECGEDDEYLMLHKGARSHALGLLHTGIMLLSKELIDESDSSLPDDWPDAEFV